MEHPAVRLPRNERADAVATQSRDLLSPLWLQLAAALEGEAFNADEPNLHRSFALAQAGVNTTDLTLDSGPSQGIPTCLPPFRKL